jgi:hypothetical protein
MTRHFSSFVRCNLAVVLLTDLVVDGLDLDCHSVDWSVHIPLILHITFLGLDNSRELVYGHCRQMLLNLLIVLCDHNDHLAVSRGAIHQLLNIILQLRIFVLLPVSTLSYVVQVKNYS